MPRLNYKPVGGDAGDRYPAWIAELEDKSGCYVIKDRRTERVLYVGESHTANLKKTLIRHFQKWGRDKRNPHAQHDWSRFTGTTYDRDRVLVAVMICRRNQAQRLQYALIQRYKPRDNDVTGADKHGDLSDIPF